MSDNQTEAITEDKKEFNLADEIFDWIESIIFSVFTVLFIFTFIFRVAMVDGDSMNPTLENKDKVIVTSLFYTPKVGDVVVVDSRGLDEYIVKRVIASEGQEINIDFEKGEVFVDGNLLDEPYINELTHLDEFAHDYPTTVPKDCIFVMGDNRNDSIDSRDPRVSFVNLKDVKGRVVFRHLPINKFGVIK